MSLLVLVVYIEAVHIFQFQISNGTGPMGNTLTGINNQPEDLRIEINYIELTNPLC